MAHPAFDTFAKQWAPVAHSEEAHDALVALAASEPSIAGLGCADLGQLVDAVRGEHRRLDPATADRVVAAMVAHQRLHRLLAVAVVEALMPGLKALARRMEWGGTGPWGHPEVFSGDLLTTAWEVVADWEGRHREFMVPALLHAIGKRLERRRQAWCREVTRRAFEADIPDREGSSLSTHEVLARALDDAADHLLPRSETSLVYAHRVLGLSMVELAAMTGQSRQSLDRRRARAERQLCA